MTKLRQRAAIVAVIVFIGLAGPALISAQSDVAVIAGIALGLSLAWAALLAFQPTATTTKETDQ